MRNNLPVFGEVRLESKNSWVKKCNQIFGAASFWVKKCAQIFGAASFWVKK
jgi:hypothetical protein